MNRHIPIGEITNIHTLELIAKNEALMAANLVAADPELSRHPLVTELKRKLQESYEIAMRCRGVSG